MSASVSVPAYFPSPTVSGFHLGPLTIHFYALCIMLGIAVAVWITARRWRQRGGRPGEAIDISLWAVPFGIVGGRIYHVITDPELYFLPGKNPWNAFAIWDGGLGIWGAVALGAVGVWIGCRRAGASFLGFADAVAPGVLAAQGIGRWGNWFNNELYGDPTTLPWGLQIHQMDLSTGRAVTDAAGNPVVLGYFQPTFLYESIWCLVTAAAIIWLDRKVRLGAGSVLALYVAVYTAGRFVFELMRSDYANLILGLRVNTWVSGLLFIAAVVAFLLTFRRPRSQARPEEASAPAVE
ncbi:diacylglyceryl transferase [Sinomonas atrocyanea]|uniref:Phosphatidylglycerol--prolipoprotein diacylglyceryl transferase n=1 Tax=Sinomonas atrocyanea TaxID=37927 RepID=A0A127A6K7_9MICC|nr:prolipoprotein diacylglyceryl transferase [Sinomonas atrocyanea]AMM34571.1 diacylglyceryl transferase [Sinomonas atrocyanea]GEB63049.1 prolipoprotein diacylglyceryl transferase [Sinomonas atrocyanea]GGG72763.1 prolipoprotein diacylglyceryl transferase [Sinomonas atrocyanea]